MRQSGVTASMIVVFLLFSFIAGGEVSAAPCTKYYAFAVGKDHAYRLSTTTDGINIKTHVKDSLTGTWPLNAEITPDGSKVYAPGSIEYAPWLTVIRTNGFSITSYPVVPPPQFPSHVRIRPGSAEAWIGDINGNTVMVVDTATDEVRNWFTLPVNSNEYGIRGMEFNADGSTLYVALYNPGVLLAVDTVSLQLKAKLYLSAYFCGPIELSRDGRYLYVAAGSLFVIDTATNAVISQTSQPFAPIKDLVVSSDDATLYVGTYGGVTVVDTVLLLANPDGAIRAELPIGSVWGLSLTPDDYYLYAADTNGVFKIIDTRDLAVVENFNFAAYDVVASPVCEQ